MIALLAHLMAWVWMYFEGAQESFLWFLALFFLPFTVFFFLMAHPERAGQPFVMMACSLVAAFAGTGFMVLLV